MEVTRAAWLLLLVAAIIFATSDYSIAQSPQQQQSIRSPCPRAIRMNTNSQFRNTLHFICIQLTSAGPRLDVIQYSNNQLVLSERIEDDNANELASFVDNEGILRILLADPGKINGTSMYSIDSQGKYSAERHTINTQFVRTMRIWRLELNWQWQLAIANQPTYANVIQNNPNRGPIPEPKPIISIHSWRSTYFDSYQRIVLPSEGRVNKIEPMHLNGQEFLIVAMEDMYDTQNRRSKSSARTYIYRLDFGNGDLVWRLFQTLPISSARDARSFMITHQGSLQRDYYIALLGQLKPDPRDNLRLNSNHSEVIEDYGLVLYKYFGDRFVKTFFSKHPYADNLDAITYGAGDSYVIIALLSGSSNRLDLYLFDGLNLNHIPTPFKTLPSARHYQRPHQRAPIAHLFHIPPPPQSINGDSSFQKRTLEGPNAVTETPVLFLSKESDFGENNESEAQTAFELPMNELIDKFSEPPEQQNGSYEKRNFIGENLLDWCKKTINFMLNDNFDAATKQFFSLPRVDQPRPIEIKGDLLIQDDLYVNNLLYVNRIQEQRGPQVITIDQPPSNFSDIFNRIQDAHNNLDLLNRQVDEVLVDDGSVQDVFNSLTFDRIVIECDNQLEYGPRLQHIPFVGNACPHVDELFTNYMNNRNVTNIQNQALLTGRSMVINRDIRFEHLVLYGSIGIHGLLNGLPIDDIVFKQGPHSGPIIGHKNFLNGLFSDVDLTVLNWNGKNITRHNFLTSSGEQRIDAGLKFNRIVLQTGPDVSSQIDKLNSIPLSQHLSGLVVSNGNVNIETPVHFEELILDGPVQLTENARLSGVDIEDQWAHTMFKGAPQNVSAPMEFAGQVHVTFGGDINVDGLVNGVILRPDSVVMRDRNYHFDNPIEFLQNVSVNDLQVGRALNGIPVLLNPETRQPELSILYNGGTQFLDGEKAFHDVILGGSSLIHGHINGRLNLTQLHQLVNQAAPYRFSSIRLIGDRITTAPRAPMQVDLTVNGIPTQDICTLAERIDSQRVAKYDRLRFEQPANFKSLRCSTINGFDNLFRHFMTKHTDQYVSGPIKLLNGVIFNSSISIGSTFNNFDIAPLPNAVSKILSESMTKHKDHFGDLFIDELITPRINNLPMSSVLWARADEPQFIRAPFSFENLDIESVLKIGRNLITESFNGLNISSILANTLQYDAPQIIHNLIEVNTLQLTPDSNFLTQKLNGHDLRRLIADAVFVDVPQQILAPKIFYAPFTSAEQVYLRHGIDDLSSDQLRFHLLLHGDELIEEDLEFYQDVIVKKDLEIQSGLINDIDFNQFVQLMLYENRPGRNAMRVSGNGSLRFKDVRLKDLVVTGTVSGLDISKEALYQNDNVNGSLNPIIDEIRSKQNNARLLNMIYSPGASFRVFSHYKGENLTGQCNVLTCSSGPDVMYTSVTKPTWRPMNYGREQAGQPQPTIIGYVPRPPPVAQGPPLAQAQVSPGMPQVFLGPPKSIQGPVQNQTYLVPLPFLPLPPPLYQSIQYAGNQVIMPPIQNNLKSQVLNQSQFQNTWRPVWNAVTPEPMKLMDNIPKYLDQAYDIMDTRYLEHKMSSQAQSIEELSKRVQSFLSISYYYEIVQKHPLLGPLLHASTSPLPSVDSLLFLKGMSKPGEPCLRDGQTIALTVSSQGGPFHQVSIISETRDPRFVKTLIIDSNRHYLFVLDGAGPSNRSDITSLLLMYRWNSQSSMYEVNNEDIIPLRNTPTSMHAFSFNRLACIVLIDPRSRYQNMVGAPLLYCQTDPHSRMANIMTIPMQNVFDLDILNEPDRPRILISALSHNDGEQVGDLTVAEFDLNLRTFVRPPIRRKIVRPLKLHFIRHERFTNPPLIQLVVSEGITSSDSAQATTRVLSVRFSSNNASDLSLQESQIIRDNQFQDIQTVKLDEMNTLLFLQSAHSVSIYMPSPLVSRLNDPPCRVHYELVQRLPTKGLNKFLVFNDYSNHDDIIRTRRRPFSHFLVLSRDDCEHKQHSTVILKSKYV